MLMLFNCIIPTRGYASHPARPQAFEHYSHTRGYEYRHGPSSYNGYKVAETDDDDWAKNPAARRQMQLRELLRDSSQLMATEMTLSAFCQDIFSSVNPVLLQVA